MKTGLAVALLLFAAMSSRAQEPIRFRGAYLGQPLSEYADCSSGKAKALTKGYRTHGNLCEGKRGAYVYHTKVVGHWSPKTSGEILHFENRQLVKIEIHIPNDDWEKVRYDLSEKLGPPMSEVPQVYQNAFGARWEFNQGFWRKENVVAYAGMKVETFSPCGGLAGVLANEPRHPCTEAIKIVITTPERAGTPDSRPNTLD